MKWRATVSMLYRSGAQTLLGESWLHSPHECGDAAEHLVTAALAQYSEQMSAAEGELVIRIASRQFECIDPPADRVAKPSVATNGLAAIKYKAGRF